MDAPLVSVLAHGNTGLVRERADSGHRPAQAHPRLSAVAALGELECPGLEARSVETEPVDLQCGCGRAGGVGPGGRLAVPSGLPVGEKGLDGLSRVWLARGPNDPDRGRARQQGEGEEHDRKTARAHATSS